MKNTSGINENSRLSMVWMKAAVLGCLWAASEIIAGSFLHNIQFPFAGIILTGIGMILLISVSFHWKEKGLILRAGLICALMKSVSPSAVIFGPMIGIFMEALLLDLAITVAGRNYLGFVTGSMMAVSWVFVQKALSFIIVYGFDILELYRSLLFFAEKQLSFRFGHPWMPLILIWLIYLLTGIVVALAGIRIGKKGGMTIQVAVSLDQKQVMQMKSRGSEPLFNYSLPGLWISLAGLILVPLFMNYLDPYLWVSFGLILLIYWIIRYRRALDSLKKPKFWTAFAVITMLCSLLFSSLPSREMTLTDGLLAGLAMNFRAALMIVGFTAAGKELSNPVIRDYFRGRRFGQITMALESAFETLPFVIGNMPRAKDFIRNPALSVGALAAQADAWLTRMQVTLKKRSNVIMITGTSGEGKTSLIAAMAKRFSEADFRVAGIISPAVCRDETHQGYDLVDLVKQGRWRLSTVEPACGLIRVGRFYFYPGIYELGMQILSDAVAAQPDIVVLDEIGAWELRGMGWAPALNRFILETDIPILMAVSERLVEKVTEAWRFSDPLILRAKDHAVDEAFAKAFDFIRRN